MASQSVSREDGRHLHAVPDTGGEASAATPGPSTLAQLSELARRAASGELVCTCSGGEVHVFLQAGRIAWATSSAQRHAFTEHLKAVTGVGDDVIEAVVSECSRTRRPIGEALIAWNVASAEQVRASLLHQIRMALESAAQALDARALFLERDQYRRYDSALTFPLEEVLAGAPSAEALEPLTVPEDGPPAGADPRAVLEAMEGFVAAAVLSSRHEPLVLLGDRQRLGEIAGLTRQILQEGQRLSVDLGAGLCHQLHIEADDAHVLVYSAKRGARPGSAPRGAPQAALGPGAWIRVVLVLRDLTRVALARRHIGAVAAALEVGNA